MQVLIVVQQKVFLSIVNPELGTSENVVLTWPQTSWFLFTGLFFILESPFLPPKWIFLINFIRILWFIWDLVLVLFDSHKDVVLRKILVFGNILGFPRINWAQKGDFMDAALPRKHFNIYNLTAINAKLMKLTTSMYLHKKLNLAEDWGVTHRA